MKFPQRPRTLQLPPHIRLSIFAAAALMFLANTATLSAEPIQLRYSKPLELPDLEKEELVAVPLDTSVYSSTRDGFPDLRLLDEDDTEISYLVRKSVTTHTRTINRRAAVNNPSLQPLEDGGLEITFYLDPQKYPHQPTGVRFHSPVKNFEHRVQVFHSDDGEDWQPVVQDGLIFDYSQFMDVRNDRIHFGDTSGEAVPQQFPRHYRILIDDVTQEQQSQLLELTRNLQGEQETGRSESTTIRRQPFRIDRLEVEYDEVVEDVTTAQKSEYPLTNFRVEQDQENQQTIIHVDSRREPLTQLYLTTPDRNFSRTARVQVTRERQGSPEWGTLGSATLSRIDFRSLHREKLYVKFPETRGLQYRIVIENRDSPPLEITGVTARGNVYEVVFLASSQTGYRLAYGNENLPAPNYDTMALKASLAEGFQPVSATLGVQEEATDAPPHGKPLFTRLLNDMRFLSVAVITLVAILAWGLYHATRRVDELE